jgi:hypothetical protein
MTTLLRINLLGASQRMRDTLSMVFADSAKDLCVLSDEETADAVMIDLDSISAISLLAEYKSRHPARPVITLSIKRERVTHADEVLTKPIKIADLCATIKRVTNTLAMKSDADAIPVIAASISPVDSTLIETEPGTQTVPMLIQHLEQPAAEPIKAQAPPLKDYKDVCGVAEDIDIDNPEQVTRLLMPLNGSLLGIVMYAITESEHQQVPIAVSLKQKHLFVLFPKQQYASFTVKNDLLQRLCLKTFPAGSFGFKAIPGLLPCMDDPLAMSKEQMLWKMTAWTYRGKLPQDTQLHERVYLRHWPNLTRLLELPDAMRISALLVEQSMSLTRAAEALGIPQRHVFAFYGAAYSIGLAGCAKRTSDYLLDPPPPPAPENANRKLLGRMVQHLRKLLS